MKKTKLVLEKRKLITVVVAVAALAMMPSAKATMDIDLANDGIGYITVTAQQGNGGNDLEGSNFKLGFLQGLINYYNNPISANSSMPGTVTGDTINFHLDQGSDVPGPSLTVPTALVGNGTGGFNFGLDNSLKTQPTSITISGDLYLAVQWDDGSDGITVYDVSGLSGTYSVSTLLGNGTDLFGQGASDYWLVSAPVPEPTTMIAGSLLLLPFGASILRIQGKRKAA